MLDRERKLGTFIDRRHPVLMLCFDSTLLLLLKVVTPKGERLLKLAPLYVV